MKTFLVSTFVTQDLLLALVRKCDDLRVDFNVTFNPTTITFYITGTDQAFQMVREVVYDFDNIEQIAKERMYKGG